MAFFCLLSLPTRTVPYLIRAYLSRLAQTISMVPRYLEHSTTPGCCGVHDCRNRQYPAKSSSSSSLLIQGVPNDHVVSSMLGQHSNFVELRLTSHWPSVLLQPHLDSFFVLSFGLLQFLLHVSSFACLAIRECVLLPLPSRVDRHDRNQSSHARPELPLSPAPASVPLSDITSMIVTVPKA